MRWSGRHAWFFAVTVALLAPTMARCDCAERPLNGERLRIVSEQVWVKGMSMTIAELPALDAATARERFGDFWRKDHREVRVASTNGIEVTSSMKDGCIYALQVPTDEASGWPARFVVTDLHRAQPALPRTFDWPAAAQGDVLSDTVSEDGKRLNRLLSYRIDLQAGTAAARCIKRLARADWKISGITILNSQQVTFAGRKGTTTLDAVVRKDGSGSVVTMNFTELNG